VITQSFLLRTSFHIEYRLIELVTRFPLPRIFRILFILRGVINFLCNRDWRNLLDPQLSVRKHSSIILNAPQFSRENLSRFVSYSLEEYEIMALRNSEREKKVLSALEVECKKIFEDNNLNFNDQNSLVILSLHYGSFTLGILALRSLGRPVYVLGSNIVNSPLLPHGIQRFFEIKYKTMNAFLNGGRILFLEQHKKQFFTYLKKGAVGVALADLLADRSNSSLTVNFFGELRDVQAGVAHFAHKHDLFMGFFLCRRKHGKEILFDLKLNEDNSIELFEIIQGLFNSLQKSKQFPKRHWLIADSFYNKK